ncbi:hypothetical protein N7486_010666 [Penicillium sp. IBT 16267x]|nr:hypothetical protein N7486_010666 [Penicillium sp. IBT 16267x]
MSPNFIWMEGEGQLALSKNGYTCRKAVVHRFDIHEALATAAPYSVAVLAYGTDFLYHQGILCYKVDNEIRLLDVHAGGERERVLNLLVGLPSLCSEPLGSDTVDRVSLLRYADNILAFRVDANVNQADDDQTDDDQTDDDQTDDDQTDDDQTDDDQTDDDQTDDDQANESQTDLLVVVDMSGRLKSFKKRIHARAQVFVRHSRTYLWYGVFRATDILNGTWIVYGVDITSTIRDSIELFRIQAANGALDQSVCFEMYNGHLYAVSTQPTLEDGDYSSYYHCFCSAPGGKLRKWNRRLWRREHLEGTLNESWADLSIQMDETTGRPAILECRKEWPDKSKSENHRTYYIQPLPIPEECFAEHGEGDTAHLAWNDHPESAIG